MTPRLLILGGTTEAALLARALDGECRVVTSLAGRTTRPAAVPGEVRIGGFGGAEGLEAVLRSERFDAVIDATHPFAARISAHAALACARVGVRRLMLVRPPWQRQEGDRWVRASHMDEAARMLPGLGRRAFLSVGNGEVDAFALVPGVHCLVRLLEPRALMLPDHELILGKGPFSAQAEEALLRAHRIDVVVTKESGGAATEGKIIAARRLGVTVLMISRPPLPGGERVDSVEAALAWIREKAG